MTAVEELELLEAEAARARELEQLEAEAARAREQTGATGSFDAPEKKGFLGSAGHGFAKGATLGAFDPGMAGLLTLFTGDPYEQTREYMQEQSEALDPTASLIGELVGYLNPKGLAAGIYRKGAGLAGKAAGPLVKAAGKWGQHLIDPLVKGAAGFGGLGAARGSVSGVDELAEGEATVPEALMAPVKGAGTSALTGAIVGPALHGAGIVGSKLAQALGKGMTGTEYNALKEWATGKSVSGKPMSKVTKQALEKYPDAASDLAAMNKDPWGYIPEYKQAIGHLDKVGPITTAGTKRTLEEAIAKGEYMGPKHEGEVRLLKKWLEKYIPKYEETSLMPDPTPAAIKGELIRGEGFGVGGHPLYKGEKIFSAKGAEALKSMLQHDTHYGGLARETPYYDKVIQNVAHNLKDQLRQKAQLTAETQKMFKVPPEAGKYVNLMDIASAKRQAIEGVGKQLGKDPAAFQDRAEALIRRALQGNHRAIDALHGLDKHMGTSYGELIEGLKLAKQLGGQTSAMAAAPQLLSTWGTGKAGYGQLLAGGLGATMGYAHKRDPMHALYGLMLGTAATSPAVWAHASRAPQIAGKIAGKLGLGVPGNVATEASIAKLLEILQGDIE